jgi:hypothetical protein
LNGDERVPAAGVHRHDVADAGRVRRDPAKVFLDVRRVDDEQEMAVGEAVDQQVVDERALFCGQPRVVRLTDLQPRRVVAGDVLDRAESIAAGHLDLAHVADVKESDARANGQVLVRDAGVLDRHIRAAKRHHPGAEGNVARVERRLTEGRRFDLGHRRRGTRGGEHLKVLCASA